MPKDQQKVIEDDIEFICTSVVYLENLWSHEHSQTGNHLPKVEIFSKVFFGILSLGMNFWVADKWVSNSLF